MHAFVFVLGWAAAARTASPPIAANGVPPEFALATLCRIGLLLWDLFLLPTIHSTIEASIFCSSGSATLTDSRRRRRGFGSDDGNDDGDSAASLFIDLSVWHCFCLRLPSHDGVATTMLTGATDGATIFFRRLCARASTATASTLSAGDQCTSSLENLLRQSARWPPHL